MIQIYMQLTLEDSSTERHDGPMSPFLPSDPAAAIARVQELVSAIVPTARCELQDYEHRIGCGDMDQWGNIQDVVLVRHGTTENEILHAARVLETKLRTGGSTAG
jgi:hypothetical protein